MQEGHLGIELKWWGGGGVFCAVEIESHQSVGPCMDGAVSQVQGLTPDSPQCAWLFLGSLVRPLCRWGEGGGLVCEPLVLSWAVELVSPFS